MAAAARPAQACLPYELESAGKQLKGILETHFHADFVSGHVELNTKTGATIYFGPTAAARCKFDIHEVKHDEVIPFTDRYVVKVLHTPGHTPESVVYLIVDQLQDDKPLKAFTGDTLFIGSCGRPDLVGSVGYTSQQMAQMMFCSLTDKILTLPDDVQVFPAHGAGSPCGKNLSSDLSSTIGKERLTNPALQYTDVSKFIEFLTTGQPSAPHYFTHDVGTNISGAPILCEELKKIPRVPATEFNQLCQTNKYPIIDTRPPSEYNIGHISHSINVPLGDQGGAIVGVEDGNFAMWVGTLFSVESQILLVCDSDKVGETLQRLARIGYTHINAILDNGMNDWKSQGLPMMKNDRVNLMANPNALSEGGYSMIDVRTEGEYSSNSCKRALNVPLNDIYHTLTSLDKNKKYVTFCKSGYRSLIGSSILRSEGFDCIDVYGGFAAISVYCPSLLTTTDVCPSMKAIVAELEKKTP